MKEQYIYGIHAAISALKNRKDDIETVYTLHGRRDKRLQAVVELATQYHIPLRRVDKQALTDKVDSDHHQGVVLHCKAQENSTSTLPNNMNDLFSHIHTLDAAPFLLVLDCVQDPHNLGACLRTADAAGVHAVIAPKDKSVSITPVVRKVACGAAESVPFIQVSNLARTLADLKEKRLWIYGACDQAKKTLYQTDLKGGVVLVLGAEGTGLRELTRKQCDDFFHIPMKGCVESLNVSVAAGVCLYEVLRQGIR